MLHPTGRAHAPLLDEAPVIHKLTISNFRSLGRDVTLALDRLTVLAGPNGSGKSNVVDGL
jgi:AAA15 family ATPase/GTPase